MLTLATWLDSMPPGCLRELVFRSGNVQADGHRLVAAGVEFDGPPCARPGHPAEAVFYDPDGNGFVLKAGQQAAAGLQARDPRRPLFLQRLLTFLRQRLNAQQPR